MKIISGMLGVLMLTLLSLPLEAKQVYIALVSSGVTEGVNNWDNLDAIIRTNDKSINHYFPGQNGNLTLQPDQELIIRGGRGSIKQELANYTDRNVILNGQNWETLTAYGCHLKRPLTSLREDTTYIMLRTDYRWQGEKNCTTVLVGTSSHVISVHDLHAKIKPPKQN